MLTQQTSQKDRRPGPAPRPLLRRGDVLRHVVETIAARRDARLPMDVPGVEQTFRDPLTLAAALQLRWYTRLAACVEEWLPRCDSPREAVLEAWCQAADSMPGVVDVLAAVRADHRDPDVQVAAQKAATREYVTLALAAGAASDAGAGALRAGAALSLEAAALHAAREQAREQARQQHGPQRLRRDSVLQRGWHEFLERFRTVVPA